MQLIESADLRGQISRVSVRQRSDCLFIKTFDLILVFLPKIENALELIDRNVNIALGAMPSNAEADAFFADLLDGLDSSIFIPPSSGENSKSQIANRPAKRRKLTSQTVPSVPLRTPEIQLSTSPVKPKHVNRTPLRTTTNLNMASSVTPKTSTLKASSSLRGPTSIPKADTSINHDDLLLGFEDWGDVPMSDDLEPKPFEATPPKPTEPKMLAVSSTFVARPPSYVSTCFTFINMDVLTYRLTQVSQSKRYVRCQVNLVEDTSAPATKRARKTLTVKRECADEIITVHLDDDWIRTDVRAGDVVHLIGDFETPMASSNESTQRSFRITFSHNFLIVNPDTLMSATRIADASNCARKAVLQEKIRASSEITPGLLYGNILHELFQRTLSQTKWRDEIWRKEQIAELVATNADGFFALNVEFEEARTSIWEQSESFIIWAETFVGDKVPEKEGRLSDPRNASCQDRLTLAGILDVEEDIWSPRFGIKGKVDVSVIMRTIEEGKNELNTQQKISPFEIKTGKAFNNMDHRAQTMLYTLLMSDRYGKLVLSVSLQIYNSLYRPGYNFGITVLLSTKLRHSSSGST